MYTVFARLSGTKLTNVRVQIDAEDQGQKVLWLAQNRKDKLYMKWYGPFVITKKINEVSYETKDELDSELRPVSVQQIVPFHGGRRRS